jgi:hypothetical protein
VEEEKPAERRAFYKLKEEIKQQPAKEDGSEVSDCLGVETYI